MIKELALLQRSCIWSNGDIKTYDFDFLSLLVFPLPHFHWERFKSRKDQNVALFDKGGTFFRECDDFSVISNGREAILICEAEEKYCPSCDIVRTGGPNAGILAFLDWYRLNRVFSDSDKEIAMNPMTTIFWLQMLEVMWELSEAKDEYDDDDSDMFLREYLIIKEQLTIELDMLRNEAYHVMEKDIVTDIFEYDGKGGVEMPDFASEKGKK